MAEAGSTGTGAQPFVVRYLPVLLLLVGVGIQAWATGVNDVAPWRGSGFSMFADIDHRGSRYLQATVTIDGESRPVELSADNEATVERLLLIPSEHRAGELAADLLELRWHEDNGVVTDRAGAELAASEAVIEVWTVTVAEGRLAPELKVRAVAAP